MNPGDFERIASLFALALELDGDARDALLAAECADRADLADRVRAMLAADARGSPLLDSSPDEIAESMATAAPRLEGRRIGPYLIRRILGRGGMGVVCLAEREDVGKQVALKLVAGGLGSPERVRRFTLERRVLAQLDHPHIARLLDAGVADDGTPWFAMDFLPGDPLDLYARKEALSLEGRLRLFEKICGAVGFAHRHLVVHRDLKPSNILVGADGEPHLLDFGIAKFLSDAALDEELTATGQGVMTPQYAAPEQLHGGPVTTATDVYQLGALLFELLTGQRPAAAGDRAGGAPASPRPSSVAKGPVSPRLLAGDLDTIVIKAMALEPDRRYVTADQLADDVRRFRHGLPIVARPPSPTYRLRKFVGRHRTGTAVATLAAIALVAFGFAMAAEARRTAAERTRAEQVSSVLTELFAGANPVVAQGDTITVRSVLDRGTRRIRDDVSLDPVVKGRLLSVIAEAYSNLGGLTKAIDLETEVVGLLTASAEPDAPARLRALRWLGRWLADADAGERAFQPLDEALVVARRLGPSRRAELADVLNDAGYARQRAGKGSAARPFYEEAMAIFRSLPDSATAGTSTIVNLAALAENRGDRAEAVRLFRQVVERRRTSLGVTHSATARAMLDLARVLLREGQRDEAERLIADAVGIQRRVFSSPHPEQITAFQALAGLRADQGRFPEAEAAQRQAVEIAVSVYGDSGSIVALATANLAGYVQRAGRLDEAAQLHGDAVRRYAKTLGLGHASTAIAMSNLAWTQFLRNRLTEADSLYRLAMPALDSTWTQEQGKAPILTDYGMVLHRLDRCTEAEPYLRRATRIAGATAAPTSVDVIRPKRVLGWCLAKLGRLLAAESLLVDAHRSLVAGFGPANRYTVAAANDLADLYRRWGRRADEARVRPAGASTRR